MTSSSGHTDFRADAAFEQRSTSALSMGASAILMLGTILAYQNADAAHLPAAWREPYNSSLQVTTIVRSDIFDDLVDFHQRLARSQEDLPTDAARLLRENLWQLYD